MTEKLQNLEPARVMYYFEEICAIPHGSYHTKAISDYCAAFAREHHLEYRQDEVNNVVIIKEASPGHESAPALILQGHLDMVCEKNADVEFDFEKDGIRLIVEDGRVRADQTTLGADNGVAVAYALAILEDDMIEHPKLEVVLTTEEEVGMEGALYLETELLTGKYLLNLDSEEEGHVLTGCAGGLKAHSVFGYRLTEDEGSLYQLKITGLQGGHSGSEIDKCRANANILIGRLLFKIHKEILFGLCSLHGGMKDNAIPREAFASILIDERDEARVYEIVSEFTADIQNEFLISDPDILIEIVKESSRVSCETIDPATKEKVLFMLMNAPQGIQTMSSDFAGLVESSLNLGGVRMADGEASLSWAVRSSKKSLKWLINDKLQYITELLGGEYSYTGSYPEWEYKHDSKFRELISAVYEKKYLKEPKYEAIHAGLECGLFAERMPYLDIVSMGPDIFDAHTPDESFDIESVKRTYELLLDILKYFKDYCV